MKLMIIGPEGVSAEISAVGNYSLKKIQIGFVDHTLIEDDSGEQQVIAIGGHTSISQEHLRISLDGFVTLLDLGSRHGSSLDGRAFHETNIKLPGEYNLRVGKVPFRLKYQ